MMVVRVMRYYEEIREHIRGAAAKQDGFVFVSMEHDGWDCKTEGRWKGQKFVAVIITIPWYVFWPAPHQRACASVSPPRQPFLLQVD